MASATRRHHRWQRPKAAAVLSRFPSRSIDQSTAVSSRGSRIEKHGYRAGRVPSLRGFTEQSARATVTWLGERERESAKRAATLAAMMDFGASEAPERESFPLPIARLFAWYRLFAPRRHPGVAFVCSEWDTRHRERGDRWACEQYDGYAGVIRFLQRLTSLSRALRGPGAHARSWERKPRRSAQAHECVDRWFGESWIALPVAATCCTDDEWYRVTIATQ